MKFLIVAVVLSIVCGINAITDEQKQLAEKVAKECAVETGLTAEEVQKLRTNPKDVDSKDVKLQKFGKCFFTKVGFVDANGDLQESVIIEKLSKGEDKAKIEEVVKQCKSVLGSNKDENILKVYACYLEKKALA